MLFALYWLLAIGYPGGMGFGDVKLAGVLGMLLGWVGWAALIVGGFSAFVLGGVVGVLLMLGRRATRKSRIPFGPFMIAGAWIGVFAGDAIARVYLTSTGITRCPVARRSHLPSHLVLTPGGTHGRSSRAGSQP